jgi:2,3-bisphosphoglycerate-independent phosphoglycerate mutase
MPADCKAIIFLGDGMGGRPVPSLEGKTVIEATHTPALDALAAAGETGILHPAGVGKPVGSDTAHMAILGYDPFTLYRGRGPFEAKGVGIDVRPGDLAFRCNFSTVVDGIVTDRRAGRIKSGTDQLAAAVNDGLSDGIEGVQVIFRESVEHRAALVLRGAGLDHRIGEVDPHKEGVAYWTCEPLPEAAGDPDAIRTARIVNEFVKRSFEILDAHPVNAERKAQGLPPANAALPRGVGTAVELEPFAARYGISGAMIVEVDLVRGLGQYLDMEVIEVPEATGGANTDEMAIAAAVVEAWDKYDFILCNIKAPDLGGHDANVQAKMEAVAKVDRAVGYLLDKLDWSRTVLMLAADHCTPISVGDHTGDGIPIAFYGHGVRPDDVTSYGERACAKGSIGHIQGADVMSQLTCYSGTQHKFGA